MANSIVTVTDSMLNDSLLLLVGEDGTVTPDKETVETYLSKYSLKAGFSDKSTFNNVARILQKHKAVQPIFK